MADNRKVHTTNYFNTFIEVAEDCPVAKSEIPPISQKSKSVARYQYELLAGSPYRYTSDEALFSVHAERADITKSEKDKARETFFSKGQPCFRASPLTKRYGWGIHADENGKIALYSVESDEYRKHVEDQGLQKVKAMRSKKIS